LSGVARSRAETLGVSGSRLGDLVLARAGTRLSFEAMQQLPRGSVDLVHGLLEHALIGGGWLGAPAHFAHVLQSGGANFFFGSRRLEVEEHTNVPAHDDLGRDSHA
jgi:hypothetical protein